MDWLKFHKENVIGLVIGLVLILAGVGLYLKGWLVGIGIAPLPILGLLAIIGAVYRIARNRKGS